MQKLVEHVPILLPNVLYRDGARYLEARQVLADAEAKKLSGNYPKGTQVLVVVLDATHSGMVINGRSYPGKKVKPGAKTWIKPYDKAVLRHHRSGKGFEDAEDPLGRVKDAEYIQFVTGDAWENDHKHPLQTGTGVIKLTLHITDPDAIQKVLDERYKTVSQSMNTDGMYCSTCDKNWMTGEQCEHGPGRMASDEKTSKRKKMTHFYTGNIVYDEVSFVTLPADPLAFIEHHEFLQDAFRGFEPEDLRPSLMLFDSLDFAGVHYDVVDPRKRESITIETPSAVTIEAASTSDSRDVFDAVFNKQSETLVSDAMAKYADVGFSSVVVSTIKLIGTADMPSDTKKQLLGHLRNSMFPAAPKQDTAELRSEDLSMTAADGKPVEKTQDVAVPAVPNKELETVKKLLSDKEALLATAEASLKAVRDEADALRTEVTNLGVEIQKGLARRLLDLKIAAGLHTEAGKDAKKYDEVLADLTKRSKSSLEDAIKDTVDWKAAKPAAPAPEVKDIPRGSVSAKDVGVVVDTAKDDPEEAAERKAAKPSSAADYKGGLMNRLKNLSK